MANLSSVVQSDILSPLTRLEAPFVRVTIGSYTFGVYDGDSRPGAGGATYPNYIQSLKIDKVNGEVNTYHLSIAYPVTQDDDPNFFEKLFSKVSATRTMTITYGDALLPNYVYRDEEAIITDLQSSINLDQSVINYTVEAVSSAKLTLSGSYNFAAATEKPSDEIKSLLYNSKYKLTEVFTGMKDKGLVNLNDLITGDDKVVTVNSLVGVSVLDRINYLVENMVPSDSTKLSGKTSSVYVLTTFEDTSGVYGGPYFKVGKVAYSASELNLLCTYKIDIGHPTANVVKSFLFTDNGGWSILYDYASSVRANDTVKRINSNGELVDDYQPLIAGTTFDVYSNDKTWWTKVTEFTTQALIVIKGILKPAILMSYLNVNVWFYGRRHISSGYYLITSQTDEVGPSGYWTTLGLTKVASADDD